jgi:hypothetical protein
VCLCAKGQEMRSTRNAKRDTGIALWEVWAVKEGVDVAQVAPVEDLEALREAFRNPPKSGGKTFDTFVIYELVKKFYGKEIKTWTELTIKLGVEPPDPNKDESSQKVTQYGVRLKVRVFDQKNSKRLEAYNCHRNG